MVPDLGFKFLSLKRRQYLHGTAEIRDYPVGIQEPALRTPKLGMTGAANRGNAKWIPSASPL